MLIEVKKSFLESGWKLHDNRIVLPAIYISLIPTGGTMITNRQVNNTEEKIIDLHTIEGISEVIQFGPTYVVVIINNGAVNSLNVKKSDLDKLRSARDYIISYKDFEKRTDKNYLSSYKFDKNDDASKIAFEVVDRLYNDELIIDNNKYDLINTIKKFKQKGVLAKIEELSLIKCDEFASNHGLQEYSVTNISDSTNSNIQPGDYFYRFDESGNLNLLKVPLSNLALYDLEAGHLTNTLFNVIENCTKPSSKVILSSDEIFDFEITGTQVSMTNSVNNNYSPKILPTMLTEFLFGTSYTVLKGMSQQMARIESKVNDLRLIQVIIQDKSDIRFKGIAIYYDFKRFLGEVKNRKRIDNSVEETSNGLSSINNNSKSVLEQMKDFKEMLDLGILTPEEFEKKKKEILNL